MGQTVARFRVLFKPVEIYAVLPLCHPQCSLLFFSQTILANIFHDAFKWSRFLFLRETNYLHSAPQLQPTPSCSSSRLLRLALLSICSQRLAILEPFPAFSVPPTAVSQQATPVWLRWCSWCPVLLTLLPARAVQRMHWHWTCWHWTSNCWLNQPCRLQECEPEETNLLLFPPPVADYKRDEEEHDSH